MKAPVKMSEKSFTEKLSFVRKTEREVAEEHAVWFSEMFREIVKAVYRDAFLHGYKHGKEAAGGAEKSKEEVRT